MPEGQVSRNFLQKQKHQRVPFFLLFFYRAIPVLVGAIYDFFYLPCQHSSHHPSGPLWTHPNQPNCSGRCPSKAAPTLPHTTGSINTPKVALAKKGSPACQHTHISQGWASHPVSLEISPTHYHNCSSPGPSTIDKYMQPTQETPLESLVLEAREDCNFLRTLGHLLHEGTPSRLGDS